MEHISTFIDSKHGKIPIKYPHPSLENILKETYGIIVYQDQVLLIAQSIAGYSLGDADRFRKAMGKKIPEVMLEEKDKFLQGTIDNGFDKELGEKVFELIEPFAGYAFNKAHSVSYAMIGYWTAYFKANYPEIFMSILMKNSADDKEKISSLIAECSSMDIFITRPNINKSEVDFDPYLDESGKKYISYGLGTIKNISSNSMKILVDERNKNGVYKSLEDFISRISKNPITKGSLEPLIKVGAFDDIESREKLLPSLDKIVQEISKRNQLESSGQSNMFDLLGDEVKVPINLDLIESEVDYKERMFWERDLMGTALSDNPINKKIESYSNTHAVFLGQINSKKSYESTKAIGQVLSITKRTTRKKEQFIICEFGLLDSSIELVIWPDKLETSQHLWETGSYLELDVKTNLRNGSTNMIFENGKRLEFENHDLEEFVSNEQPLPSINSEDEKEDLADIPVLEEVGNNDNFINDEPIEISEDQKLYDKQFKIEFIGSQNKIEDKYKFEDVIKLLLENKNDKENSNVSIEIFYDENSIELELPLSINYSEDLKSRLDLIIGSHNIIIT